MSVCRVSCTTIQKVTWQEETRCQYDDELAVFRFRIFGNASVPPSLERVLHPDELQRAQRYFLEEDRQRFVYARSLLRVICGQYTNQPPDQIQFAMGVQGKLELSSNLGWYINVSHSGNWILLVVGRVNVGVDVEKISPQFAFEEVLINNFSQEEQVYCSALEGRQRFYDLWTRKEALLKATGKGMVDELRQVPSLDGLHETNSHLIGERGHWIVKGLTVAADYPAAVAYQETQVLPKFYTLNSVLLAD